MTEKELIKETLIQQFSCCDWTEFTAKRTYDAFVDIKMKLHELPNGPRCVNGATRFVLVYEQFNWVVKIPYGSEDYCDKEVQNYQIAENAGVSEIFAPIEFLMEFNTVPIYIMKKVNCEDCPDDNIYTIQEDLSSKRASDEGRSYDEVLDEVERYQDEDTVGDLLGFYYGDDLLRSYYDLCEELGINDVHCANVGYIDGKLVVIDFAGF